jgi:hypothetical protein
LPISIKPDLVRIGIVSEALYRVPPGALPLSLQ